MEAMAPATMRRNQKRELPAPERVMKALKESGFNGVLVPDHSPGGMWQYTLGYLKALRDRADAEVKS